MADDEAQVTRGVAYFDDRGNQVPTMVDPLVVFFWARLDEDNPPDAAAKRAILDDYERRCRDTSNPAREMECGLIRSVIRQLAAVYSDHPDYPTEWRP